MDSKIFPTNLLNVWVQSIVLMGPGFRLVDRLAVNFQPLTKLPQSFLHHHWDSPVGFRANIDQNVSTEAAVKVGYSSKLLSFSHLTVFTTVSISSWKLR